MRTIAAFVLLALFAALARTQPAAAAETATPPADAAPAASIPIELPEAPATPSPAELVGGWHGIVFLFIFLVVLTAAIVLALEATHAHHFWHDCEHCYHHYPPPPPPPPPHRD